MISKNKLPAKQIHKSNPFVSRLSQRRRTPPYHAVLQGAAHAASVDERVPAAQVSRPSLGRGTVMCRALVKGAAHLY